MKFQNRLFITLVICMLQGTLYSQFSIQYTGPTVFYLDNNCADTLDLNGAYPLVTALAPGATVVVDSVDAVLTGYGFGDEIVGELNLDIVFRIEDDLGNDSLYVLPIQLFDTIPPVFLSAEDTLYLNCASDLPELSSYVVDDNCDIMGGVSLNFFPLQNLPAINCSDTPIQANNLIIAEDFYGNADTLFQVVYLLKDTIAPTIEAPADTLISCSDDLEVLLETGLLDLSENCEFIVERDSTVIYELGSCSESFIVSRYWTVRDSCGNTMIDSQRIEIRDDISPTFTLMQDTILDCDANYTVEVLGYPLSIMDNCSGLLDTSYIDIIEDLSCSNEKSIKRVWTVRDSCLNTIVDTQRIMLIDTIRPTFTLPLEDSVFIDCSEINLLEDIVGPSNLMDNCSVPEMDTVDILVSQVCPNTYQLDRWYYIADECGNMDSTYVSIFVEDNEGPVFVNTGTDYTEECAENMNIDSLFLLWLDEFSGIEAEDNCSADNQLNLLANNAGSSNSASLDFLTCQSVAGFIVQKDVDFIAEDECGNSTLITRRFSIRDQVLPSILYCGIDTVIAADASQCSANYTFSAPVVQDNCGSRDTLINLLDTQTIQSDGTSPNPLVQAIIFSIPVLNFSSSVAGDVNLVFDLNNVDAEGLEEYFDIIGEDGTVLGQTNSSAVQCGASQTSVLISASLFNDWIADGLLRVELIPNSPSNPIDGINPLCGASTASLSVQYSAVLNDNLSVFYSLDNAPYSILSSGIPLVENLDVGLHNIQYKVIDCGRNERSCSFSVEVLDVEAPVVSCPGDQEIYLTADSCTILAALNLPLGVSDNCSPGTLNQINKPQQIIGFSFNSNISDFVADTIYIEFSGIDNNFTGGLQLDLSFTADMDQLGEYFDIYSSAGDFLGTTEVGNVGVVGSTCSTAGSTSIEIDALLASSIVNAGNLSLILVSNNPFFPGIDEGGINPCSDTTLVNGIIWDSTSLVQPSLTYSSLNLSYYLEGATNAGPFLIDDVSDLPEYELSVGESVLNYVAEDAYSNKDTCSVNLMVYDTINPVVLCDPFVSVPFNSLDLDPSTITPSLFDIGSMDNCTLDSLYLFPSEISCTDAASGSVIISMFGIDSSGNQSSCQSTLVIQETPINPLYAAICEGDTILNVVNTCFGDSLYLFSNVESSFPDLLTYTWYDQNNNQIAEGENTVIALSPNTDYSGSYSLEVVGPNGCEKTDNFVINAFVLPEPTLESSTASLICEGTSVSLNAPLYNGLAGVEYNWYSGSDIGNGVLLFTGSSPTFNLGSNLPVGINCFYLEVIKDCCSAFSPSVICFEVLEQPLAIPLADTISVCELEDLELSALGPPNPDYIYEWSGPGIPVGTVGQTVIIEDYNTNGSGLFIINLEVYHEDLPSCSSVPADVIVEVLEKPETPSLALDNEEVCVGATVTFTAIGDFTGVTAFFFIGDTQFSSADSTFSLTDINFNDQGIYRAVLGGNGCLSDPSNEVFLDVLNDPIAEIISDTEICSSEDEYSLNASNQTGLSYSWILPSGDIINGNPLNINNPDGGSYYLEVDGGLPGCLANDTLDLVVNVNPQIVSISDNIPVCPPDNNFVLQLDYESVPDDIFEEQWFFNNSFISNDSLLQIMNADLSNNGIYTLVLKDSLSNCVSDSLTVSLNLSADLAIPSIPITADNDYQFCVGENVSFQTGTFLNDSLYIWALGDGNSVFESSSSTVSITNLSDSAAYQIRVRVLDENGCLSEWSDWRSFEIIELPEISVSAESFVCTLEEIQVSVNNCVNLPGAVSWELPDNSVVNDACLITDTQELAGDYYYTYVYQLEECITESDSVLVVVNSRPETPEFSVSDLSVCLDRKDEIQVFLTNQEGGVDYVCMVDGTEINSFDGVPGPNVWSIMDLEDYNQEVISISVGGLFNSCASEELNTIDVILNTIPNETAFISEDTLRLCFGELATLEAQEPSSGITGLWTSLDSTLTIVNPDNTTTAVGGMNQGIYYDFEWSLSLGACTDFSIDTSTIYIAFEEQAFAGLDRDTCPVDLINLFAAPSINSPIGGEWSQSNFQDMNDVGIVNPFSSNSLIQLNSSLISEYSFVWTLPDYGCGSSSDTVNIKLLDEFPMVGADFSSCGDGSIFMNGIEPINYTGVWSSPNPNISFVDSSAHNTLANNLEEGINIFHYEFLGGICGEEFREEVLIDYRFDPIAFDDVFVIDNAGSFSFLDVIENDEIISDGDISVTILTEPFFGTVSASTQNEVRYSSDPNYVGEDQFIYQIESAFCGTLSQATVTISIGENPDCNLIPNIISPNEDGYNDQFVIPCIPQFPENKVEIFNVWGDKVFEAQGYQNNWAGDNLPSGTYYYVIRFSPSSEEFIGFLHIQR